MPRPWKQWVVDGVSRGARRFADGFKSGARKFVDEVRRGDWKGALKRVGLGFLFITLRLFALILVVCALFILTSALVGRTVQSSAIRWIVGVLVAIALPLAVQGQAEQLLRRFAKFRVPGTIWFVTVFDLVFTIALVMTFGGSEAGATIRRHGDWIYGYSMSPGAQRGRAVIHAFGVMLERFRLPDEMKPWTTYPDKHAPVFGPTLDKPPQSFEVRHAWLHPLAGERQLPYWETRRFGSIRAHHSPEECESGHCGNDLAADFGAPVFCSFDGVVERVERDARGGGLAGRYIRVGHLDGKIVTRYLHLDSIRSDLREGDRVSAGEVIGRVGRTGVVDADTHLHFALSTRPTGTQKEVYLDPEPYLAHWDLIPVPPPAAPIPVAGPRVGRRGTGGS
jgi:murein DD-endopeptidase MepM/ murein hydrolase activator NlpD